MSLVADLVNRAGVVAAGEYSYRGDRFSFRGDLSDELARHLSIMCRSTTMASAMQGKMLNKLCSEGCPLPPVRGWMVEGPKFSICVIANVFCLIETGTGSVNELADFMIKNLASESLDLL